MAQRKVFSIDPADTVEIQMGDSGIEATKPITIGQLFKNTVDRFADHTALSTKEQNEWKKKIYKDLSTIRTAKLFLKVCVCVCICVCGRRNSGIVEIVVNNQQLVRKGSHRKV